MKGKKIKKLLKNKRFIIFMILLIILIVCLILLKGVFFPSGGSNYGNRLDGIKTIKFSNKTQKSIVDYINENEKVNSAKLNIHGKIINVIFDVKNDVSEEDAKSIANASLEKFSKEVKSFYDIQFMITKSEEEGTSTETTDSNGDKTTTVVKTFPIMGYKNSSRDSIVW